ncbi:MAG TPA: LamG-like jellyroll fold domain-containing protein, partial [Thermoguttaceae bacterium]|nr:LamG-like jellyroll fold domain-containing protein [Thermoguttaceae bacterium]
MKDLLAVLCVTALMAAAGAPVMAGYYDGQVLLDNPLLYYRFEETSSLDPVVDYSGSNYGGSYLGNAAPVVGMPGALLGNAATFDGDDDSVEVNHLITSQSMSVETWFSADTLAGWRVILNHDGWSGGNVHYQFNGNPIKWCINGSGDINLTGYTFNAGEWYHVVTTYDGTVATDNVKLYVNGDLQVTMSQSTANVPQITPGNIGAWNGIEREWDGMIDEFAIYGSALSADRVMAHYLAASGGSPIVWDNDVGNNLWGTANNWDPDPNIPDEATPAIINSGAPIVEADHRAFAVELNGGQLTIDSAKTLTLVSSLTAVPGTQITLRPGSQLIARSGSVHLIQMQNDSLLGIDAGAIGEVNLTGSTGTIANGGGLEVDSVSIPALGTFVKSGAGTLAVGEVEALQSSTIRIDEGMLTAKGSKPLGNAQNLILNGGTANLIGDFTPGTAAANPLQHWAFDDGLGTTAQNSLTPGVNNGTLVYFPGDGSQWVTGMIGGALQFDGVDDQVQIISYKGISGATPRTMSAWVKTTDTEGPIIAWGTNNSTQKWVFRTDTNGAIRVEVNGGNIVGQTSICDDLWHHVAAVLPNGATNANQILLYVDGRLDGVSASTANTIDTAAGVDVVIGSDGTLNNRYLAGAIDDVYIYDRALTSAEVGGFGTFSLNTSTVGVRVTADSTLMASVPNGNAQFGRLTLQNGMLTTAGAVQSISFAGGTTIADGATSVGIDPQVPTDYGTIDGGANTVDFTLSKTGTSYLSVRPGFMQNMDNATIDAHQGTLAMIDDGAWGGAVRTQLSGGTLRIEPGDGTLAYWSLDDSANLGRDDSGAGHDLELINSPSYFQTGRFGGTARFDGDRDTQAVDYDAAEYLNGLDEVTIAMWIKADPLGVAGVDRGFWQLRSQSGQDQWGARYDAAGGAGRGTNVIKAAVTTTASGGTASRTVDQQESRSDVQTTNWQHVAITWEDGVGFKLYLDGVEDTAPTSPMTNRFGQLDMVSYFMLGRGGRNEDWWGLIDEVYIANYALSAAEINAMKNDGFAVQAPEMPDLSSIAVAVTEPSTLSVGGDGGGGGISTLQFGPLTLHDGAILTTQGGTVTFNRLSPGDPADTTIAAGATAVGFDPRTDTRLGTINGNDAQVTIAKVGPGDLVLDQPSFALDAATFDVRAGRLIGVSSTATPFGGAALLVGDGELVLTGRAGESSAEFDNEVLVGGGGTLTAGKGGVGPDAPMTVNLVAATLDGVLNVRSTDGYTLDVQAVGGTGGARVTAGTVVMSGGVDAGYLEVAGGSLSTPNGTDVGRLMLTGGTLATGANLTANAATVTGGTLLLGENDLVLAKRLTVGQVRYDITPGTPLRAAGSDLTSAMDLTLGGGSLTIADVGADGMPAGLQLWLDADDRDTLFRDTAGTIPLTADGQAVARWNNKAGNGPDVSEGTNTPDYVASVANLNNAPALHFDGDVLRAANTTGILGNDDRTAITVWANAENTGANYQHTFHMGNPATNQAYGHSVSRENGGGEIGNHYWGDGFNATPTAGLDGALVAVSTWDGDGGTAGNGLDSWWVNGHVADVSDRAALDTGDTQLTIGSRLTPPTEGIRGDIAEVLVFDRVLSSAELNSVGGYLADKYGLATTYTGGPLGSSVDQSSVNLVVTADSQLDSLAPIVTLGNLSLRNPAAGNPTTLTLSNTVYNFQDVTADDGATIVGQFGFMGAVHPCGEAPLFAPTAGVNPTIRHGLLAHLGTLNVVGLPELAVDEDAQGNVLS